MLRWPGVIIARACLAVLLAWSLVAPFLATWLIVSDTPRPTDALVVLAGSAAYPERTAHAARLFHAGLAPKVLLTNDGQRSRWSRAEGRNPFFYERALDELLRHGVPRGRIEVLPERVSSTFDEAVRLRRYACTTGLNSLMIVTSGYHTRRARWILRAVLPASVTLLASPAPVADSPGTSAPTAPPETVAPSPALWWLRPRGWQMVAGEYVKGMIYWMRYPVTRGQGTARPC